MGRKYAREMAMQCLYQLDIQESYTPERVEICLQNLSAEKAEKEFALVVAQNLIEHREEVDEAITSHLKAEWKIDRIAKVDLAILRVAITEILFLDDIPESVSINEAVNLSKKFGDDSSRSFVNGLLGGYLKAQNKEKVDEIP